MKILLLFFCFFLASCAIDYKMPSNRFETPETVGENGKQLFAGVGHGLSMEITPDYSQKWGDAGNHSINYERFFTAGGYFGLKDDIDFGAKYVSDEGLVGNVKWQFAGRGKEKGFKGAGSLSVGYGVETKEENNHTPTKAELTNTVVGLDLIFGYRTGKSLLIYTSAFYDSASYSLKQRIGSNERTFEDDTTNYGATAGLLYNVTDRFDILFEYARSRGRFNDLKRTDDHLGGRFAVSF